MSAEDSSSSLPSPTYVDTDEDELLAVCSRCWGATAEAGSEWCSECILGGEDEDEGASEGVQGV